MTVTILPAGAASSRPGRGPHRRPALGRGSAAAMALAAALLAAAGSPAAAGDLNLTLIDNSEADSWLEIDRTANTNSGSGTSGSDHDGSAVDLMDTLINPDSTDDEEDGG
ncbi:hypothetical protein OHT52_11515 [Streptomyces sp. NBC_00247]|uniref:hypothetical protein n=1 Tax=Streptomyces sp. NBC_00247 TaxID=2975689 RepID=UPI002E2D478B|nr:hypothetical protein [Streptomyces sp. NBC_00247]